MKLKTNIIITLNFPCIHYWENCNVDSVKYLKNPHRHIFYVTVKLPVMHTDRDIEFISKKREIEDFVNNRYKNRTVTESCEHMAESILIQSGADYVSVFEDNENGAEVYKYE